MRRHFLTYTTLGGFTLLLGSLMFLGGSSGCYGDQCTGSVANYGQTPGEGRLLDPDSWESNAQVSNWLDYSHQRSWYIYLPMFQGREIGQVYTYISPDPNPNVREDGKYKQYTLASGNLAEITIFDSGQPGKTPFIQVHNDTCADYFARIVITAYPAAPDAGTPNTSDSGPTQYAARDTGATE